MALCNVMVVVVMIITGFRAEQAKGFYIRAPSLRMLHRFSPEPSKRLALQRGGDIQIGSPPYYRFLHVQDRFRHRHLLHHHTRGLLVAGTSSINEGSVDEVFFSSGNETMNYGQLLGWLHYAVIDIGTPNTSFLVALDTGSNLLWVPCMCHQCAPIAASSIEIDIPFNVYNPATSNTSEAVACGSSMCAASQQVACETKTAECSYTVQYLSDNTSTSGVLIQDVLHLRSQSQPNDIISTPVVFGCGQVQSGGFLDGGAPDGLLGLGMGKIAVPSYLAKSGLIKDAFSMCFHPDNSGRIFFGDKGLPSQQKTKLLPINGTYLTYTVSMDSISVGAAKLNVKGLNIIVDSGTSFTYLPSSVYTFLTEEFNMQISHKRTSSVGVPFEFCYDLSGNDDIEAPSMSITFQGGGNFSVYSPSIGLGNENGTIDAFCLAVLSSDIAILGQSFMTGYKLVFDREELKLGWSLFDCYKSEGGMDAEAPSSNSSASHGRAPSAEPSLSNSSTGHSPLPSALPPHSSSSGLNRPFPVLHTFSLWIAASVLLSMSLFLDA